MKKKGFTILLLIFIFTVLAFWSSGQGTASRSIFEVEIDDHHLTAGRTNKLKIEVQNEGGDAGDVEAKLSSNTPYIVVLEGVNTYLGDIDEGDTEDFKVLLVVAKDTPLGPYSLALVLTYEDETGITSSDYVLGVLVDAVEEVQTNFNVVLQDYYLTAGVQTLVKINMSNLGPRQVYHVEAQLLSQTPYIVVLKNAYHFFDHIGSNETVNFTSLLSISRNTPLGPYTLIVNLQYQLEEEKKTDSYTLGCVVGSSAPYKIQIVSISRENEDVVVTLENVGNETLTNIFVSLQHDGVIIGAPYEIQIKELHPTSRTVLRFRVTDDVPSIEIIINYDDILESSVLQIPAKTESDIAITCAFSSRKADVGSTIVYDLLLRNRGPEAFYYLKVQGLPEAFTSRFMSDNSEVVGLYLKKTQEESVSLEIKLPTFPRGFGIDDPILFYAIAVDTTTYTRVIAEPKNDWLVSAAGALELTLTPTIHDMLPIGGESWENELANPTSEFHYPGIPYSVENLPLGAYVAPKFELNEDTTYIFSLYGTYVGTDIDLNLHVFNASGTLLGSSSSTRGRSDMMEIHTPSAGIFLVAITNDESLSQRAGSATLVVSEKWDLEQSSSNTIGLYEGRYPNFLISEVRAFWIAVEDFQGQDMTLQVEWSPSLGAELRVYPFTRNSQKEDYDPLAPNYLHNSSLVRGEAPQTLNMIYTIARDEQYLLIVFTKVQGIGDSSVHLDFSSPLVDFWSYSSHRKEFLLSMVLVSVIGLFALAYLGEKYIH